MKKTFISLLLVCGFINNSHSQVIDTVQTFDFGKMPPVYFSSKVYWERNYNNQNHLMFEGLKYKTCFIGAFVNYWNNGKAKTKGQYIKNNTYDWTNLQSRVLCSVQDSVWKNYNEARELSKTVVYKKGEIVKEY